MGPGRLCPIYCLTLPKPWAKWAILFIPIYLTCLIYIMRYRLKKLALHTTCIIHVMGAHIYSMDVNLYILCAETVARPALPVPPLLQIQNVQEEAA